MSEATDTFLAAGQPVLFSVLGEDVEYKDKDADAVTVLAILGNISTDEDAMESGTGNARELRLTINTDPSATAVKSVPNPRRLAKITARGLTLRVIRVENQAATTADLVCTVLAAREVSAGTYRKNF